jgi:hypothetical protein
MNRAEDPDDVVRDLLRQAPPAVDAARAARVRAAVHGAWQEAAGAAGVAAAARRRKQRVLLAVAAVLVSAVGLTLVNALRERAVQPPVTAIASSLFLTGEVVFEHDGQTRAGRVGDALMPGTRIVTNGGRAAIALTNGIELRLDANTAVTLDSDGHVSLGSGALYLDSSHRTGPPETVAIAARGTVIRNLGTRYEVRLTDQELRVRVRDGQVEVESAFGMRKVAPGNQVRVTSSEIVSAPASTSGPDWEWIVRAIQAPRIEGRPLAEFLAWAEREGGRPIRFADPALERATRATIVYGAIERLTVEEALDVVLPSCGLARRPGDKADDVITIVAANDTGGAT